MANGACWNADRHGTEMKAGILFWLLHGRVTDGENALVTVNYAPHASQCYIRLPFSEIRRSIGQVQGSDEQCRI